MTMTTTYNFNVNPAYSAQFSTMSTSSADTSGTMPLSDGSAMTMRGLLVPGNRREASSSSGPDTNYKKFSSSPCGGVGNAGLPFSSAEEQQNLLNWSASASSQKSTKSSSAAVVSFCCSYTMGRRVNCCIGTLLAVCTLFILASTVYAQCKISSNFCHESFIFLKPLARILARFYQEPKEYVRNSKILPRVSSLNGNKEEIARSWQELQDILQWSDVCVLDVLNIIGSCVLAAGIIILLQLYVGKEPFGLGAKLSAREDGGSELVWILRLVGWFVTLFGVLLVVIGFSGCTGSFGRVKRDYKVLGKVFLFIFLLLVLIVFVTTLGFTILTIVFQESIQLKLKSELSKSMNYYQGERKTHPSSIFWNFLQLKMECCGTEKAEDWAYNIEWHKTREHSNQSWPYVCCKWEGRQAVSLKQLDTSGVPRPRYAEWEQCYRFQKPEPQFVYTKGCSRVIAESVERHSTTIYLSLACFLATLTLAIIFAAILCRHQNFMFEFSMDPLDM